MTTLRIVVHIHKYNHKYKCKCKCNCIAVLLCMGSTPLNSFFSAVVQQLVCEEAEAVVQRCAVKTWTPAANMWRRQIRGTPNWTPGPRIVDSSGHVDIVIKHPPTQSGILMQILMSVCPSGDNLIGSSPSYSEWGSGSGPICLSAPIAIPASIIYKHKWILAQ